MPVNISTKGVRIQEQCSRLMDEDVSIKEKEKH
jgi:hypothetical protein